MRKKQFKATAMALIMAASLGGTAYGAVGPSGQSTTQEGAAYGGPAGTSEEDAAKGSALSDNKMEYGELGDLIATYNVSYKNANSQLVNATLDLGTAKQLSEDAGDMMDEANALKSNGLTDDTRDLYNSYKETAKELRKQAQKLTNAELSTTYRRTLRKSKAQLTVMAQQMMIGYNQALSNQELVNKSLELAQASLEATKRMAGENMKTQEDIQTSEQTYKQAENAVLQFNAKLQSVKQNLQMVTGWNHDAEPEICQIPDADLRRIDGMNPQNDLADAIGANYELQDLRNGSASGSSKNVKKRNISQAEQELSSTLQSLYATVLAKKQALEAAQMDFAAAEQNMQAAERKNSLGMLGRLEYLNAQVAYMTSKSAKEAADIGLFSAMETYDWAVKGLVLSGQGGM